MLSTLTTTNILADAIIQTGTLAVVGAWLTHVMLPKHPMYRLAGQVIFFLALTVLLTYQGIVPYEATSDEMGVLERVFIGLAKVVWWISTTLTLAGFVRIFLIFESQPRQGRLIQDLIVGIIYVGAVLSVVAYVFSFPVGTLIATSGIFAIILGLAMQSTLSDVFSGIALNLGRTYAVGEWIRLGDGIEGRVLETNWRATHLINGTNDLVILPNSSVAKSMLTNLSRPDRGHGVTLAVRLSPSAPPSIILNVMRNVLLSSNSILANPPPGVSLKSLDGEAIEMELSFRVPDIAVASAARDEIFDLVYRHAKAAGLSFVHASGNATAPPGAGSLQRTAPLRLLDALPLFAALTEDEKEALAGKMTRRTYHKDDIVVAQGMTLATLMIVRNGVLVATHREGPSEIELSRMAPGDCFGEAGLLTGAGEAGTIRALTFVVVYEIAKDDLAQLMQDRPGIIDELGAILSRRVELQKHLLPQEMQGTEGGSVARLASRIRHFFQIPRADS